MTDTVIKFEKPTKSKATVRPEYKELLSKLDESHQHHSHGTDWFDTVFKSVSLEAAAQIKNERTGYALFRLSAPLLHRILLKTQKISGNPLNVILTDGECFNTSDGEVTPYDIPMIGVSNYLTNPSTVSVSIKRHIFDGAITDEVQKQKRIDAVNSTIEDLTVRRRRNSKHEGDLSIRALNGIVREILDHCGIWDATTKHKHTNSGKFILTATYIVSIQEHTSIVDELTLTINTNLYAVTVETYNNKVVTTINNPNVDRIEDILNTLDVKCIPEPSEIYNQLHRLIDNHRKETLLQEQKLGKGLVEIGKKYNISKSRVHQIIKS